ncbi:MAG: hypothetical protein SVX28_02775 [Pseudomonadota bacterium]|nr:hypothetical protein [Pseudomonadota bacterium]
MYSRIEVPVRPHPVLALTANLPWLLLALFCLFAASRQPVFWYSAGLVAMIVGIWRTARALRFGAHSITRLIVEQNQLRLCYPDGRTQTVRVAPETRLGGRLSILKLVPDAPISAPVPVVLSTLPGMSNTDARAFRRLRVWLRLGGVHNGDRSRQPF